MLPARAHSPPSAAPRGESLLSIAIRSDGFHGSPEQISRAPHRPTAGAASRFPPGRREESSAPFLSPWAAPFVPSAAKVKRSRDHDRRCRNNHRTGRDSPQSAGSKSRGPLEEAESQGVREVPGMVWEYSSIHPLWCALEKQCRASGRLWRYSWERPECRQVPSARATLAHWFEWGPQSPQSGSTAPSSPAAGQVERSEQIDGLDRID